VSVRVENRGNALADRQPRPRPFSPQAKADRAAEFLEDGARFSGEIRARVDDLQLDASPPARRRRRAATLPDCV
jgi:hypothetical protein